MNWFSTNFLAFGRGGALVPPRGARPTAGLVRWFVIYYNWSAVFCLRPCSAIGDLTDHDLGPWDRDWPASRLGWRRSAELGWRPGTRSDAGDQPCSAIGDLTDHDPGLWDRDGPDSRLGWRRSVELGWRLGMRSDVGDPAGFGRLLPGRHRCRRGRRRETLEGGGRRGEDRRDVMAMSARAKPRHRRRVMIRNRVPGAGGRRLVFRTSWSAVTLPGRHGCRRGRRRGRLEGGGRRGDGRRGRHGDVRSGKAPGDVRSGKAPGPAGVQNFENQTPRRLDP